MEQFTKEEEKIIRRWIATDGGKTQKKIEFEYRSDETLKYTMPDGKIITVGRNAVGIFETLQSLPTPYKLCLLEISKTEVIEYFNETKIKGNQKVLHNLNQKWIWRETGERYRFNDIEANGDLFEVAFTKSQITDRIKRGTLKIETILKILDFFETQDELIINE